jgi:glycerol uptake facilitator-like aquaporin
MSEHSLSARLAAECLGTAFLLAAIVGSGIMAQRLTGDTALALLANTMATAAMLFVIILLFAPISGAHFNPVVTLAAALRRQIAPGVAVLYAVAQIAGALIGVWLAHAMFELPVLALGIKARDSGGELLSEAVATFGLVLVVLATKGKRIETVAASVALYIASAYWFTASTSFANPAVTIARSFTPTFAGIYPGDAPAFIFMQLVGAMAALLVARLLAAPTEN